MSFTSILKRALQNVLTRPTLWLYGLVLALLGWTSLPFALFVTALRSSANPIGGGGTGALALGALVLVAFSIELMLSRALARRGNFVGAVRFILTHLVNVVGFLLVAGIMAVLFDFIIAFPIYGFFLTLLGNLIAFLFPFVFDLAIVVFAFLSGVALILPVLLFVPLGMRALAIGERGAWEALGDALTLGSDYSRITFLCMLLTLGLDLGFFALGAGLGARDLMLTAQWGIVSEWTGVNLPMGALLLVVGAGLVMFKAALWTVCYETLAQPQNLDRPETAEWGAAPSETPSRSLELVTRATGAALHAVLTSPLLFLIAAIIAFVGLPGPAELLTQYNLFPERALSADANIWGSIPTLIPVSGTELVGLAVLATIITAILNVMLIIVSDEELLARVGSLGNLVKLTVRKLPSVFLAELIWIGMLSLLTVFIILLVLFGMALFVDYVPGLNGLADALTPALFAVGVGAALLLSPLVARAVIYEDLAPRAAFSRAFDIAFNHFFATLSVLLLTVALELLKGPFASLVGLITNGWSDVVAIVYGPSLPEPIGWGTLAASLGLYIVASLFVAFNAALWTQFYHAVASETPTREKVQEAVSSLSHPARSVHSRGRKESRSRGKNQASL